MSLLTETIDTLFVNCRIATMAGGTLSSVEQAAVGVTGELISWVGPQREITRHLRDKSHRIIDLKNRWILPGFVDCHTHLVFGGSRSREFELRLNGATYEEIAQQGGGILSTVNATRNATHEELYNTAAKRIAHFITQGTTTLEIKSGYGLDLASELKMLDVIDRLNRKFPVHIAPTFLGAHTLPPEFMSNPDGYIDLIVRSMLPAVKNQGIATAVDVFCERIAFSRDQTKTVFKAARKMGFDIKLHAEQLSDCGGASLAARMGALSCDHLEYLSESCARHMADHKTVAVLLPGAFYFLKETRKPPVQLFRDLDIPMAVSTDLNPGSSPVHSMPLILNMACQLFGMTCEEALVGATLNGARALGMDETKGSIEPGKDADLVVWDIDRPADLCYLAGFTPVDMVMISGDVVQNHLIAPR